MTLYSNQEIPMLSSHADPLRHLVGKLGLSAGTEPERVQRKLMDYLGPMVRVALRRGVGQPALLRWLRQQLGDEPAEAARLPESGRCVPSRLVDRSVPEGETDELVRRLARLLTTPEPLVSPGAETVLGA
jgi:hypothetical protein